MRIVLAALCAIALAAAATFVASSEKMITVRRAALRDFDARASEAADALAELRVAQQAYVAAGQGTEFWMPKVDAIAQTVGGTLAALQQSTTSPASKAAVDEALAALVEFGNVDRRIRDYLNTSAQLMAADIVFTEGGAAAAGAARDLEKARVEEHVALDSDEASRRRLEVIAAGSVAALMLIAVIFLAATPAAAAIPVEAIAISPVALAESPEPGLPDTRRDDLVLRGDEHPVQRPPDPVALARPVEPAANAAALKAAAQLCTDIGRVSEIDELRTLLGRAAELLDASGLVLWLASASGLELRPAVAHGYTPQTVARIPALLRSADNASAAAFRTGTLQIVLSRPGSPGKGAIVAPVLSVDGCIGVLSAEVRDGAEALETVQALATILAAQLGGVIAATPAQHDERASGGAAV